MEKSVSKNINSVFFFALFSFQRDCGFHGQFVLNDEIKGSERGTHEKAINRK